MRALIGTASVFAGVVQGVAILWRIVAPRDDDEAATNAFKRWAIRKVGKGSRTASAVVADAAIGAILVVYGFYLLLA